MNNGQYLPPKFGQKQPKKANKKPNLKKKPPNIQGSS
jgi:hypothetical protein